MTSVKLSNLKEISAFPVCMNLFDMFLSGISALDELLWCQERDKTCFSVHFTGSDLLLPNNECK